MAKSDGFVESADVDYLPYNLLHTLFWAAHALLRKFLEREVVVIKTTHENDPTLEETTRSKGGGWQHTHSRSCCTHLRNNGGTCSWPQLPTCVWRLELQQGEAASQPGPPLIQARRPLNSLLGSSVNVSRRIFPARRFLKVPCH